MSAEERASRGKPIRPIATSGVPTDAPRSQTHDVARARARLAWKWVDDAVARPAISDKYGTLARKLSSYLQVSGLGQTMAFLYSKARGEEGGAHGLLFEQLAREVTRGRGTDRRDMQAIILDLNPADYRRATGEAVAIALWLKRFAEGRLGEAEE